MRKRRDANIDIDYLRRCKKSTPEQRLDWLAMALEFTNAIRRPEKRKKGAT